MTHLTILFRCGHRASIDVDKMPSPVCGLCGDRQVARVLDAPVPRFTGVAVGPHVTTQALEAVAVSLAESPLRLKPDPLAKES
jgi:hypothetical protein